MTTSTDVAVPQQQGGGMSLALPSIIGGDMPGLAVLEQWSKANDYAARLVAQWIFTDLVPVHHWPLPPGQTLRTMPNPRVYGNDETDDQYRRRCEIATASASGTVLRGISIGLPPNIALEQMHSIRGTIGMKVKAKYALATSRGIKAWDVELDDDHATCAGIHPTTGETVTITITMAQAKKAGWTDNAAYGKTPQDMLWARSMGRVLDRVAGHVLFGLPSVEDVEVESRPVEVTADPASERPTRAAILAGAGQQPEAEPEVRPRDADLGVCRTCHDHGRQHCDAHHDPEPAPVERAVLPITDPQMRMLGAVMAQLGVTGTGSRERRLAIATRIVDHPLASSKELTKDEASTVIDKLTNILNDPNHVQLLRDLENGQQQPAPVPDADSGEYAQGESAASYEDYDPNSQWDGMDGAEAAAEGGQG